MSKTNLAIVGLILIGLSLACKSFLPGKETDTSTGPTVDFTTPGKSVDVKVQLDKKHTSSSKISPAGGTVSLTSADGSKFLLDVPANALDAEIEITMTAVKTMDGAPLDGNKPTAVQLEPSGQFFKEMLTLTIIPAKEIPIENRIVFGYEDDGKDYHLAPVDPNSKEIKVKLMGFSGAGAGSGSDAAWAAHLRIEANDAKTRLVQKFGEATQAEQKAMSEGAVGRSTKEVLGPLLSDFKDQVVLKGIAAAELDCRYAQKAMEDLIVLERILQLAMGVDSATGSPGYKERAIRLLKIGEECKKAAFQIVGGLHDWQTNSKVCDIMQPFELTGGGITMKLSGGLSGTYSYAGIHNAQGSGTYAISLPGGLDKPGTMTGTGDGSAGGASNSGTEKYTLTPIEPCAK
jgi:hypothetical protein